MTKEILLKDLNSSDSDFITIKDSEFTYKLLIKNHILLGAGSILKEKEDYFDLTKANNIYSSDALNFLGIIYTKPLFKHHRGKILEAYRKLETLCRPKDSEEATEYELEAV
jgi:hypothetical protein